MVLDGPLSLRDPGESKDVLFCGEQCLAEWAQQFHGQEVEVTFRLSGELVTVSGRVYADYGARYSEVFDWTDEDFRVGDTDLIAVLKPEVGKHLHLRVTPR